MKKKTYCYSSWQFLSNFAFCLYLCHDDVDYADLGGKMRWCYIHLAALIQIPSVPFANGELKGINSAPEAQIYLGLQGIYPEITQTIARFA